MSKSNKKPAVLYVGLLLLCLTLVSVHLSSGLYARYTMDVSGSDTARVAKFSFDLSTAEEFREQVTLVLKPGDKQTYEFSFANNGETTLEYTVELINTTGNLPLVITEAQNGVLPMGESAGPIVGTVEWPTEAEKGNPTSPVYAGMVDVIVVRVTVEQVD